MNTNLVFEDTTSPLDRTNDGTLRVDPVRETQPHGWAVVDTRTDHVQLFTLKREIADAFVAGWDYAEPELRGIPLDVVETDHRANVAKLRQLAQDADAKAHEKGTSNSGLQHWSGVRDGLLRAITVIEGRG